VVNREDIIRIVRQAGGYLSAEGVNWMPIIGLEYAEKFAALVAAHEREKVAHWMVERGYATGHGDTVEDLLKELEWQAAEREREGYRQGYADAMNWKTQNHLEHLPGREWVGLTVEEIKSLRSWWPSYEDAPALLELVKDVEAKLKEKNNGV
jgi:sulfur relay (sulfurtransferase) DsrC/TusE family protein